LTAIVIIIFAAAFLIDYLPIIKAKDKKTSWVYGVLLTSSFIVLVLFANNIVVPSPSGTIKSFITSLLKLE